MIKLKYDSSYTASVELLSDVRKTSFNMGAKVRSCSALMSSVVNVAAHSDERAFVTLLSYPW